jgi:hypothetical protein
VNDELKLVCKEAVDLCFKVKVLFQKLPAENAGDYKMCPVSVVF